jgi:rhamnosyltransferase
MATTSIVIPTLNPGKNLLSLFNALLIQKPFPPQELVIIDSGSSDNCIERIQNNKEIKVKIVKISHFSHSAARNLGVKEASGEIIVLMTQDALPYNENWLYNMLMHFSDQKVAAVFSRQVPYKNAPPTEQFFLNYHFPDGATVRRSKPANGELNFSNVFFSNVSAAIRRALLLKYPFDESLIMSEDQQIARDFLNAGYDIIYEPSSIVQHSHNYTLITAFRRYFDSVYSLSKIFNKHNVQVSARIGIRYLKQEFAFIAKKHPLYLPYYLLYTLAKASGTFTGHYAEKMPLWLVRKLSLHSYHWK